jgi:serine/threonine-protein kinase
MKPPADSVEAPPSEQSDTDAATSGTRTALSVPARFKLIRRSSSSGSSEVVEALDRSTGRIVVLKLAATQSSSPGQAAREAEMLARLKHPGIVRLEASGIEGNVTWLALERLQGLGLQIVIRDHAPLPWTWIRSTLIQILDALQHAHEAGIVHGDVKPANCFCCEFVDARSLTGLKLLDFGVAQNTAEPSLPENAERLPDGSDGIAGSAAYLAPELAAGGKPTTASDLYAVGIMAHELLLGYVPFAAGGSQSVLWQQQHTPIAPLAGRAELLEIPETALKALDQALDKRPEHRPASARALRDVLAASTEDSKRSKVRPSGKRAPVDSQAVALVRLGEAVRRIWIDDYLNETRRGFVDVRQVHRWQRQVNDPVEGNPVDANPGEAKVVDAEAPEENALLPLFERAGGQLVVLGEPGFGKTVAALKLCRALLDLRQRSQSWQSTPVMIPLSAWRGAPTNVSSWLAGELHTRYSVPRRLCAQLLQGRRLVLLLDGLDEVPSALRQGCVDAIDALIRSANFAGVVVTCRTQEYRALTTPLTGPHQVELQRLELTEIQRRVRLQGFTALADALESNARLAELATVPLMLRLLQGVSREAFFPDWVQRGPISAEGLLDRFLEGPLKAIAQDQRTADLVRVARLAVAEGQDVLRCEALQPRMLKAGWSKLSYALLGRMGVAAIACFGPLLAVAYSPFSNGDLVVTEAFAFELSAKSTLVSGLSFGVVALLLRSSFGSRNTSRWVNALAGLLTFAAAALWVGIHRPPAAAVMAVEASLLALIALWWARPPISSVNDDVALDRDLRFQLPSSRGLVFAGLLGAIWAVLALASTQTFRAAAYMGGSFAAVGLLLAALRTRRDTIAIVWNAAFWKALRSAYLAAALTVAVVTACFAPAFGLFYGACVALTFGAIVFLWLGGTDAIYYALMRLHLAAEGTLPLRSQALMSRAVSARLMKRVGGGYAFVHWELAARLLDAPQTRSAD